MRTTDRLTDFDSFRELMQKGGMEISGEMYSRFMRYAELLCEWNERMNLTAITDPEGIAEKHFFDSVYPFTLLPPEEGAELIDVGTGAGFPSLPLGIYRGDIKLTLLDSLNKRVNFLKTVSEELELGAECIHGRAEETARFIKEGNPMREAFDIASARAVADMTVLCEYCLPFVRVGGWFYALKGKNGEAELDGAGDMIKRLGGSIAEVKSYTLPGGDERVLIVIEKTAGTPDKFPRNMGQIRKKKKKD